ncbi:hypothetical protein ASPZODRAFT_2089477 [Penicilliopsis zonata CBS 506.65]|uniref:Protein phosphatase n=1 Tax=Penicilliopsis zonata CBS 506.65 TaxID=1073090 RepID=A0A1L9SGL1_9EURO|nr:hypothetical protein ASPZODRAFT_2089477 [Penicilliopsis zonata CBS 506.65]OJJ46253.1 hypothetical protein ASPZODRAFT_2089477 [Penicilliopsis zonata CBS 506.65]
MNSLRLVCRACSGLDGLSIVSSGLVPAKRARLPTSKRPRLPWCVLSTSTRPFHSTRQHCSSSPDSCSDPPRRISYRVAVSSSGKGRRFHPAKNVYDFDPAVHDALGLVNEDDNPVTRRKQRPDSGEDAFFVSKIGCPQSGAQELTTVAFGIADGVGGWTESRVDPADFSHALCGYMARSALSWESPADTLKAKSLLQMGYDQVVADKYIQAGGSTASVGIAHSDGRVELANLGDSGSVLLRLAAVHHYSIPQTHGFNTPYQLSIIPPQMRKQASIFGGSFLEDLPRDASVTNIHMQHGDVLLLATDGVFDNLNNQDILKNITSRMLFTKAWTATVHSGMKVSENLADLTRSGGLSSLMPAQASHEYSLQGMLAASVASEAKLASVDIRRDGPFAKEAQRYYPGDWYRGGKVDDICVLVVVAVEE